MKAETDSRSVGHRAFEQMESSSGERDSLTDPELVELYTAHADFVWRSLARYGIPMSLIDDGVQDVFLIARRKLATYDERGRCTAWLVSICRRVAAGYRRSQARRDERERDAAVLGREPVDPERELAMRDAAAFVQSFLDGLEPARRDVFILCDVEGLSAPEASQALGIKLNTVYSRLRHARKRFEMAIVRREREKRR